MNQKELEKHMVQQLEDNLFVSNMRKQVTRMNELFCAQFLSDERWRKDMYDTMTSLRDHLNKLVGGPTPVVEVRCESGRHLICIPTEFSVVPESQCIKCHDEYMVANK